MPKTRHITVYQFDELDEKAKERARDWYRSAGLDYDWYESTYDDAAEVGLEITGFDVGRGSECTGKLTESVAESIKAILKNHGEMCETYKTATQFKAGLELLDPESDEYDNELETLEKEYLEALCEDYLSILRAEFEYLYTAESVDENILANEYEFLEDGTRA